eukprot:TRINITY_DN7604_c0_g1_i1.p1 TRINITY_DN7604_c0_g1~~TRINITY_DN7604_c0_g1_i1.p1  ORF type:complete len:412 (+),score=45.05 TRINITY_DN7604_c0_g1_i1:50-1285(+)
MSLCEAGSKINFFGNAGVPCAAAIVHRTLRVMYLVALARRKDRRAKLLVAAFKVLRTGTHPVDNPRRSKLRIAGIIRGSQLARNQINSPWRTFMETVRNLRCARFGNMLKFWEDEEEQALRRLRASLAYSGFAPGGSAAMVRRVPINVKKTVVRQVYSEHRLAFIRNLPFNFCQLADLKEEVNTAESEIFWFKQFQMLVPNELLERRTLLGFTLHHVRQASHFDFSQRTVSRKLLLQRALELQAAGSESNPNDTPASNPCVVSQRPLTPSSSFHITSESGDSLSEFPTEEPVDITVNPGHPTLPWVADVHPNTAHIAVPPLRPLGPTKLIKARRLLPSLRRAVTFGGLGLSDLNDTSPASHSPKRGLSTRAVSYNEFTSLLPEVPSPPEGGPSGGSHFRRAFPFARKNPAL